MALPNKLEHICSGFRGVVRLHCWNIGACLRSIESIKHDAYLFCFTIMYIDQGVSDVSKNLYDAVFPGL